MNIHFTDKVFFEDLKAATLAKVRVGSHLYGTNNENSDEDFLYIYATSQAELGSVFSTNHQLQYKENDIDHNFVSLHQFIKNCINGDSPINFEVIQSEELSGTDLDFLTNNRTSFRTYTIIRSYNGFVKRDIKHYNKATTDYEKRKRLGHIVRGILYTDMLLKNEFNFRIANIKTIENQKTYSLLDLDPRIVNPELQRLNSIAEEQRKLLNEKLDNGTLGYAKTMDVQDGMIITQDLQHLMDSLFFKVKQDKLKNFDLSYFIKAFENWVQY